MVDEREFFTPKPENEKVSGCSKFTVRRKNQS